MAREDEKWVGEINPNVSELSDKVSLHWQTTAAIGLTALLNALKESTVTRRHP